MWRCFHLIGKSWRFSTLALLGNSTFALNKCPIALFNFFSSSNSLSVNKNAPHTVEIRLKNLNELTLVMFMVKKKKRANAFLDGNYYFEHKKHGELGWKKPKNI